jgi:hypothetical protein
VLAAGVARRAETDTVHQASQVTAAPGPCLHKQKAPAHKAGASCVGYLSCTLGEATTGGSREVESGRPPHRP